MLAYIKSNSTVRHMKTPIKKQLITHKPQLQETHKNYRYSENGKLIDSDVNNAPLMIMIVRNEC